MSAKRLDWIARQRLGACVLALAAALSACASGGQRADDAAAPPAEEGARPWNVGFTWFDQNEASLEAAARAVLERCVLGRVAGLEDAEIRAAEAPAFLQVVDRASGERRLWMGFERPVAEPWALTLNLNWRDGVGPGARVAFLANVDAATEGDLSCPSGPKPTD